MSQHRLTTDANDPGAGGRVHLAFLDGLRGLAALYVVFHHFQAWSAAGVSPSLWKFISWTQYGHFTVNVFILLSGFSLMLPVAASANYQLRGGTLSYLKRRARGILPAYYAALLLSLAVVVSLAVFKNDFGRWQNLIHNVSAGDIVAHLLLVHNFFQRFNFTINMAHWSVATEWQIYFLFPLILLPVCRWNALASFAVALGLGLAPHFFLSADQNLDWACPWFVAVFSMGMLAAICYVRGGLAVQRPWLWLVGVCLWGAAYVALKQWFRANPGRGPETSSPGVWPRA